MNPKTLMTLAVACGCGVIAMFGIKQATNHSKVAEEETVEVLIATADIPVGMPLDETLVKFKTMPKSHAPEGVVSTIEEYEDRALRIPAVAGETILAAKLGKKGDSGLGMTIPAGYRIAYFKADGTTSFSNLLKPGERVDVIVTFEADQIVPGQARPQKVTKSKTLLEYVEVFSVNSDTFGTSVARAEDEEKTADEVEQIGLLMTPEQANYFMLAKEKAKVHLTWRSKTDKAEVAEGVVDQSILDDLHIAAPDDASTKASEYPLAVAPEVEEFEEEMDFQSFLDSNEEEKIDDYFTAAPAPMPVQTAAKPKWTMHIYSGGQKDSVEVDLLNAKGSDSEPSPQASSNDTMSSFDLSFNSGSAETIENSAESVDVPAEEAGNDSAGTESSSGGLDDLMKKFLPSL